jgi:hypothetical protein
MTSHSNPDFIICDKCKAETPVGQYWEHDNCVCPKNQKGELDKVIKKLDKVELQNKGRVYDRSK